jgi:hypothetical protein
VTVDDNSVITLLASITDPPEPASRVSIPAALRRGRRQRLRRAGAGALVVVAVAAAAVAVPRSTLSGTTGRPSGPGSAPAGWAPLPGAPVAARSDYAAVWTGQQMIVWGGYSWGGSFPVTPHLYGDGAAYDPTTRTWTAIAASPLAPRVGSVAVWTGKEMLVFGGTGPDTSPGAYSGGAAYNPSANTWRKLAPTPRSLGTLTDSGSYAVWTGKVMLVWGFFGDGDGDGSLAAATYNPATNRWATGAIAPAPAPLFGDAFWTGTEMLVWGTPAGHPEGLSYDPATRSWASLPAAPLGDVSRSDMLAAWTGTYMVVGGGVTVNRKHKDQDGRTKVKRLGLKPTTTLQKDAALYDPVTNRWTRLPDAPVGFEGSATAARGWDIWTGASVITIEDGVAGGRPLSLDLATMQWSLGPKAPVPGRQEAHELWSGQQVLVWGGGVPVGHWCCKTVVQGYGYRP